MPLTIEMQFTDRYEFRPVSKEYIAAPGEVVVNAVSGPVKRTSLGPGSSTTVFADDGVIERWQADRRAAAQAMTDEGKPPLGYKSDEVLVAEHLSYGIVEENSPGVMTGIQVSGPDPEFNTRLESFLSTYFNIQPQKDAL